ncbi:MAG: GT4 family glycosyltransferase PelF [Hyphomicrobium sp.]
MTAPALVTATPVDRIAMSAAPADVCLIVEGCYPYVPGGVSAWIDWLMRSQPQTTFSVVSLWPKPMGLKSRYTAPANLVGFEHLYLQQFGSAPKRFSGIGSHVPQLSEALTELMTKGGQASLAATMAELHEVRAKSSLAALFNSPAAWRIVQDMYRREMPNGSFLDYFWAWRALLSGLLAVLEHPLPKAGVYHTISTGYAGLLAARARLETGRPTVLTEHGIYTNERRIELLMADWVADTIDKGHALDDPRFDLRDMWVRAFEAYARTCYETSTHVVTLYGDNQGPQRNLGAQDSQLSVIANGIDVKRFAHLKAAPDTARPTMALIGRVVPIKDVKTFIEAARHLSLRIPDLRALVVGPTEEDPVYFEECRALVETHGLAKTVEFTGPVNILDYLEKIHVMVLTSLSESQPLVVLEAGAAGIPFIATDVGSCREIIEGRTQEHPHLGRGGTITHLAAADEIADAAEALLRDHALRRRAGDALKARVSKYYTSEQAAGAYNVLYSSLIAAPGDAGSDASATGGL